MAPSKPDLVALVAALAAHAGIAYGLVHVRARPDHRPTWIEVDVRKRVPPPPPKFELPPPPPERKAIPKKKIVEPPPTPPPPNAKPPPEPPSEPEPDGSRWGGVFVKM